MGITGLIKSNAIINIDNALIYLSTFTFTGNIEDKCGNKTNNSASISFETTEY